MRLRTLGHKLKPSSAVKVRLPEKRVEPFYLRPEWRALIESIVAERGRRCEDPGHDPRRPRECRRVFGDHVDELKDGGAPLDRRNVLLRCGSCHTRKTAAARRLRLQGGGV